LCCLLVTINVNIAFNFFSHLQNCLINIIMYVVDPKSLPTIRVTNGGYKV
jgi:hypothetical protein